MRETKIFSNFEKSNDKTKMNRMRIVIFAIIAAAAMQLAAARPSWEEVKVPQPPQTERPDADEPVISSHNGYIYVFTSKPVEIKIFSILGQLIKQEKISAGTYRYRIDSKGIYIVKAGTVTRRVTI